MIKTIIFDIGNVLAGFDWKAHYENMGLHGELLERVADATVRSEAWRKFDQGEHSDQEILDMFIQNDPEVEAEIRRVFADPAKTIVKYDYAVPWVRELKSKGYQVLLLSNYSKTVFEAGQDGPLEFIKYVDGGVISYQVRQTKPDPAIYRTLIERYALNPRECVFLDDLKANIEAASQLSFHTIHFTNREAALKQLAALLAE